MGFATSTKKPLRKINHRHKQEQHSIRQKRPQVTPIGLSTPNIQRKVICACDGGCPRCQEDISVSTNLEMSHPREKYEQQADQIASQVAKSFPQPPPFESLSMTQTSGQPLPPSLDGYLNPLLGYDFRQTRLHVGPRATESARMMQARAYTVGHDIVFGENEYAPHTTEGLHRIIHELVHEQQQHPRNEPQCSVYPFSSISAKVQRLIQRQAAGPMAGPPAAPPVVNPILAEWNAHPRIHPHFANGFQTYSQLHPLYQARGIANPAQYLDNNITSVTFLTHYRTFAHQDMQAYLTRAETHLTTDPAIPIGDRNAFWAFVPRTIVGQANQLSNHALGKAIDINPGTNPLIRNQHDIRVIKFITNVDFGEQQAYGQTTATGQAHIETSTLREATEKFRSTFSQLWLNQLTQTLSEIENITNSEDARNYPLPPQYRDINEYSNEIRQVLNSANRRLGKLMKYKDSGFIDLEQSVIDAFVTAGFKWGGEYERKKDTMHFEI